MSTLTSLGPELVARSTQAPVTATYASICRISADTAPSLCRTSSKQLLGAFFEQRRWGATSLVTGSSATPRSCMTGVGGSSAKAAHLVVGVA